MTLTHKFVDNIPEKLKEGTIYVSIPFETIIHLCCCGCKNEVVTPLSPTDWNMTFDGETITLNPSIGNWNFQCKSHYFIRKNRVVWSRLYSDEEIEEVKRIDIRDRQDYIGNKQTKDVIKDDQSKTQPRKFNLLGWFKSLFG